MKTDCLGRIVLAISLLAWTVSNVQAFPTLNESFDYPEGPLPYPPWKNADAAHSVVSSFQGKTNVLCVSEKVASAGTERLDLYPINSGTYSLEFDVATGADQSRVSQKFYFRNLAGQDLFTFWLRVNGLMRINNDGVLVDPMTPEQWYHVKLVIDFDNDNLDAYVDDVEKLTDYAINNRALEKIGYSTYNNAGTGNGAAYWDNLKGEIDCKLSVEPMDDVLCSADEGQPATPSQIIYTLTNTGQQDNVSYTVAEIDYEGFPTDYSWLSLDKTNGGPISQGLTDEVTATIDTTGLSGGIYYIAYLKFTDDCVPAQSELRKITLSVKRPGLIHETFDYPEGPLPDPPWNNADYAYRVVSGFQGKTNVLCVSRKVSSVGTNRLDLDPTDWGIYTIEFDVATELDQSDVSQKFFFRNLAGQDLFTFWIRVNGLMRINNDGVLVDPMTPEQWYHVKLVIDFDNDNLDAYVDGVEKLTDYAIENRALEQIGYSSYDPAGGTGDGAAYWDNLKGQRHEPFADADVDGDVDQDDFAKFQACFTGDDDPGQVYDPANCMRFNRDDTDDVGPDIDEKDFQAFQDCATGPGIKWSQELTPACNP